VAFEVLFTQTNVEKGGRILVHALEGKAVHDLVAWFGGIVIDVDDAE
jgi:hypothetical protein